MTTLYFATASNGLVDFKSPVTAAHQPVPVQIAALLVDGDGTVIEAFDAIIDPVIWNYSIPDEAAMLHGITTARALAEGIPPSMAIPEFDHLLKRARTVAAYSYAFHRRIVERGYHLQGLPLPEWPQAIDVMRVAQAHKEPGAKFPTMRAAAGELLRKVLPDERDALHDVHVVRDIHRACQRLEKAA